MNKHDFKRILTKFADKPDEVIYENGIFIADFDGAPISVQITKGEDGLLCAEDGFTPIPAKKWIINRLGKLDILAHAILDKFPYDDHLIDTPATLISPENAEQECNSAVDSLISKINQASDFSTDVLYLTSEAGEGKTCIMNALARKQAEAYIARTSDWLFVPIALSGRPFLRLDEIIIGTLANFYRFRGYYFESFLEMMKLDSIVLGLDGFEEMAIEGAEGDVISSLGNLLNGLDSEGTMVFAARKAYYNYSNLKTQARLFDSFKDKDVSFIEIYLNKWRKQEFCSLLQSYGFTADESNKHYDDLESELHADHPILTRAVLARMLAEEIAVQNGENINAVISKFKFGNNVDIFSSFVNMLLQRETTKWVTKADITEALLTVSQHEYLLESVAEEMWSSNTLKLKQNILFALTELACDSFGMSPPIISQCKERVLHHALVTLQTDGLYTFCHEEFYLYFLGKHIAHLLISQPDSFSVRKILDKKTLNQLSIQECSRVITKEAKSVDVINYIMQISKTISRNSCLSQNLCSILIPLINNQSNNIHLNGFYCSSSAISCTNLNNITFENCIIEKITLDSELIKNVSFSSNDVSEVVICQKSNFINVKFDEKSLPQVLYYSDGNDLKPVFDPITIANKMIRFGLDVQTASVGNESIKEVEEDDNILLFFKIVQAFQRATALNENVLRTKTGKRWRFFEDNVLNPCLTANILKEDSYDGHGSQRRFKLNVSFSSLENARRNCLGMFDKFISLLSSEIR